MDKSLNIRCGGVRAFAVFVLGGVVGSLITFVFMSNDSGSDLGFESYEQGIYLITAEDFVAQSNRIVRQDGAEKAIAYLIMIENSFDELKRLHPSRKDEIGSAQSRLRAHREQLSAIP